MNKAQQEAERHIRKLHNHSDDDALMPGDLEEIKLFIAGAEWRASQGWVSVEERLPEMNHHVIAFFPEGTEGFPAKCVAMGVNYNGYVQSTFPNSTAYFFKASHWMPLPTPPKQ